MTSAAPKVRATLLRNAICLTSAKPRPSPTKFYFPGLTAKPWHSTNNFDWVPRLEASVPVIRDEYLKLKAHQKKSDYELSSTEHKLHSGSWDWYSYVTQGRTSESPSLFQTHCPHTVSLLHSIPGFMTDKIPFAYSFFSSLKAKSSIKAHSAPCNIRLRIHLPLIVPKSGGGCSIRVGDEVKEWEEGKCMVFDDSYDHDSRNDCDSGERVVLLFDIWHPDLEPLERQALIDMFGEARSKGWLS